MVIVQIDRKVVAHDRVLAHGTLEDHFLDLARQVGPQAKRRAPEQPLKVLLVIAHICPVFSG